MSQKMYANKIMNWNWYSCTLVATVECQLFTVGMVEPQQSVQKKMLTECVVLGCAGCERARDIYTYRKEQEIVQQYTGTNQVEQPTLLSLDVKREPRAQVCEQAINIQ